MTNRTREERIEGIQLLLRAFIHECDDPEFDDGALEFVTETFKEINESEARAGDPDLLGRVREGKVSAHRRNR